MTSDRDLEAMTTEQAVEYIKSGQAEAPAADPGPAPAVNLWQADWPYPELGPAQYAALYSAAADVIRARGYYAHELQGYAGPGISVCGALKVAALEAEQAAAPLDPLEARYGDAVCVAEELETRLAAVLYVLGQLHTRTGIRDLADQLAGWELAHFHLGPGPDQGEALALLGHAAAMFGHLAETTSPVTAAPDPQ